MNSRHGAEVFTKWLPSSLIKKPNDHEPEIQENSSI